MNEQTKMDTLSQSDVTTSISLMDGPASGLPETKEVCLLLLFSR